MNYVLCFVASDKAENRLQACRIIRDSGLLCIELDTIEQVLEACKTVIPELILLDSGHSRAEIDQWVETLRDLPRGLGPTVLWCERQQAPSMPLQNANASGVHVLHQSYFPEELHFFLKTDGRR